MSRPPINPEKSLAGIAVDPLTLERVVPESRRPDGRYTLDHHIPWCSADFALVYGKNSESVEGLRPRRTYVGSGARNSSN